ncbi:unnamed protein product [Knipowitschia caucasica]|uniref:PDZ domain-containing protein n=1 Tax=Knipowitschia caucasica TaxID=637954 RepID=A0AAV2J0M8_KNICA
MKTQTGSRDIWDVPRFTFNPKEGIDNPALNINDDDDDPVVLVPRIVHLQRLEGQSFGFSLRGSGPEGWGLEVSEVQVWSQAEQSGLRPGDRVLEVNEEDVTNARFEKVERKIKFCGCNLFLLVLRKDDYEQAGSSGLDLASVVKSFKGEYCHKPRLCHIIRNPDGGLGFTLISLEGHRGQYIVSTESGGAAERAGVCSGDKLICINGTRVSSLTLSAINRTLRKSPDSVTVLVIDGVSEECFIKRKMPIVPEVAECFNFPHRAKTMNLSKGKDGYGFVLRQEKMGSSHKKVHVLREVDSCSPAEEAGMEDGDLLLAVNTEAAESLEHDDIVRLIRQSGDRVSLTTMSRGPRDFYRQLGISPLLFHQDPIEASESAESCDAHKQKMEVFL